MCSSLNAIGRLVFDPANLTGIFADPVKTPKIDIPDPATPSASALQNMSSVGTQAKVQLGKQDKNTRLTSKGVGSRTSGSSLGGLGASGSGLKL